MECQRTNLAFLVLSLVLTLGCVSCLSGCKGRDNQRELTLHDFDFMERSTALDEIVERLGWPDRSIGSGLIAYQYDLADGRTVELSFFGEKLYARVQEKDGTWTDLALSERPRWSAVWRIGRVAILVLAVLAIAWWIWKRRQVPSNKT